MYTIVNVAVMHMRAPKRRPVVKPSGWWNTNGSRQKQHRKNIADIESLRPSLSTVAAAMRRPGNSSGKLWLNVTWLPSRSIKYIHAFIHTHTHTHTHIYSIEISTPGYLQNLQWIHFCSSHPGTLLTAL